MPRKKVQQELEQEPERYNYRWVEVAGKRYRIPRDVREGSYRWRLWIKWNDWNLPLPEFKPPSETATQAA